MKNLNAFSPLVYLLLMIVILGLSCSDMEELSDPMGGGGNDPVDTEMEVEEETGGGMEEEETNPQYLDLDSDYLFDQDKLHTFQLTISPDNMDKLDSDPAAEEYVPGALIFEGDTLSEVGVRYKGSIGAFVGCVSGANWGDPSGSKTCTKLSMKVKINWEGRTDKFYGLKKLQFHSMNNDPSQMRERLGYWMFREMGLPAPRCVHARLVINGEFVGLFALVEQIDGRFTRYNWDDGEGNLYKEVWPVSSDGSENSEAYFLEGLKTNEDENPSVSIIQEFGAKIAAADDATIQSVIEEHMDIREIISYCVVDRVIRHDDGPFHWYCNWGSCNNHNYYWYEEPGNQKMHLVAWDLDFAFENISNQNPVTHIPDEWDEQRNDCRPFRFGPFSLQQRSAACDPLMGGWAMYQDEYANLQQEFLAGPFSVAQTDALLSQWADQVSAATTEAYGLYDDAISSITWQNALSELRGQLDKARQ